jgi:hypothetical protein
VVQQVPHDTARLVLTLVALADARDDDKAVDFYAVATKVIETEAVSDPEAD